MTMKFPIPHAQARIVLLSALLRSGEAVLPNGAKVFLPGDRTRSVTAENVSNVINVTSSVPFHGLVDGTGFMVSDIHSLQPQVVEFLNGVEKYGIRLSFVGRQGFRAVWENHLILYPLSKLIIEVPLIRAAWTPDVDYVLLRENGTGRAVITDSFGIELEFI